MCEEVTVEISLPSGLLIRRTDWDITESVADLQAVLTDAYGSPTGNRESTVEWTSQRFVGIYQTKLTLCPASDRCVYQVSFSRWFLLGQLFVLTVAGALLSAPWPGIPVGITPSLSPDQALLTMFALVVSTYGLSRAYRGPQLDTALLTDLITNQRDSYSMLSFLFWFFGAVLLGSTIGTVLGNGNSSIIAAGGVVFGVLAMLRIYGQDSGTLFGRHGGLDTVPEIAPPHFTGQFQIGAVTALPAILGVFGWVLTARFFPLENGRFSALLTRWTFPILLTVVFCWICYRLRAEYQGKRLATNLSGIARTLLLVGLGTVNMVTLILLSALFLSIGAAFYPALLYQELLLTWGGLGTAVGLCSGCLLLGTICAETRIRVDLTALPPGLKRVATLGLGALGLGGLLALFAILTNLGATMVTAVLFGNNAILDASPQTVRTTWESHLLYTPILPQQGYWLTRGLIAAVQWLPIVFVAIQWAHHLDTRLEEWLRLRRRDTIELGADVVPDKALVTRVPGTTARVTGGVLTRPRILIGEALLKNLNEKQLNAVLAHEAYHIEHQDSITTTLASAGGYMLGGANVLLSFVDLARREVQADQYASRRTSGADLEMALISIAMLSSDESSETSLGISLSGDFAISATREQTDQTEPNDVHEVTRISRLLRQTQSLLWAPRQLLFGGFLFDMAHPSMESRLENASLPSRALNFVRSESRLALEYPYEATAQAPVPREHLVAHLEQRAISRDFAASTVASLIEDGELVEVEPGYVLLAGGDSDAPA